MRRMYSENQIKQMMEENIQELSKNATLLQGNFEDGDSNEYVIITTNTKEDDSGRLSAFAVSNEVDIHRITIDTENEQIFLDDSIAPLEMDSCSITFKNIITNEILFELEI